MLVIYSTYVCNFQNNKIINTDCLGKQIQQNLAHMQFFSFFHFLQFSESVQKIISKTVYILWSEGLSKMSWWPTYSTLKWVNYLQKRIAKEHFVQKNQSQVGLIIDFLFYIPASKRGRLLHYCTIIVVE